MPAEGASGLTIVVTLYIKGGVSHTVSANLMLILSTSRVTMHPSYLRKVFSFIIFIKERYAVPSLSEKSRAPGGFIKDVIFKKSNRNKID